VIEAEACFEPLTQPEYRARPALQLFPPCRVLVLEDTERNMNTNLIRAQRTVMDGWPILVAFALYVVAFGIFAMTTVPEIPVV
jgi:hypothetical protein